MSLKSEAELNYCTAPVQKSFSVRYLKTVDSMEGR